MFIKLVFPLFVFVMLIILCQFSFSDEAGYTSLYADHKAKRVGDIVTIIVEESSKASKSSATQTMKKSDSNGSLSELFGIGNLPLKMGVGAGSDYSGSGTTTRSGSMDATISVSVKEVLPNGNLLLEGKRNITVNDDIQTITIKGVVRPEDIRWDNTVLSVYIANAEIKYEGVGPTTERSGAITGIAKVLLTPFHWIAGVFRRIL